MKQTRPGIILVDRNDSGSIATVVAMLKQEYATVSEPIFVFDIKILEQLPCEINKFILFQRIE